MTQTHEIVKSLLLIIAIINVRPGNAPVRKGEPPFTPLKCIFPFMLIDIITDGKRRGYAPVSYLHLIFSAIIVIKMLLTFDKC